MRVHPPLRSGDPPTGATPIHELPLLREHPHDVTDRTTGDAPLPPLPPATRLPADLPRPGELAPRGDHPLSESVRVKLTSRPPCLRIIPFPPDSTAETVPRPRDHPHLLNSDTVSDPDSRDGQTRNPGRG